MQNTVDEIKSKLDIVEVISEYIQLKPAGTSFKAVCPFHREKAPSFFVSPEKQIWHCFGCGKGGSIFDFVMEIEGVEFPEALRILAQKAGVEIKTYDKRLVSQNTKLLDIGRLSSKFYHKVLLESSLAEGARKYLKERGLDKMIIGEFQIGFAPEKWDALLKFLLKRGYKEKEIEAAGLVSKKSESRSPISYYDRFRNRIMFPIFNVHSQIVGFTGRIMPGAEKEEAAKYINTPETPVYNKSRVLYGLDKAKLEAKKADSLILVEGNMDVLACHQSGTKNVVCTSGTALTPEQIKLLRRYSRNIILAFDVDPAGQTATQRSIDLLLEEGLNVKVLVVPEGKDPDECIRKTPEVWANALKAPQPIMEYYFSFAFQNKDLSNIEDKKEISRFLLPILAKLGDPVEQGFWLKKISNELDVSEISLREGLGKIKSPRRPSGQKSEPIKEAISPEQQAADRFLGLALKYPQNGEIFLAKLIMDMFVSVKAQDLVKIIKECYSKNQKLEVKKIRELLKEESALHYLDYLFFLVEEEFKDIAPEDVEKELNVFFRILKRKYLDKKMREALLELREAEKDADKALMEKITRRIAKLSSEMANV